MSDTYYSVEQRALAVCLSLIGFAVACRLVLAWLDRKVSSAVAW